MIEFFQICFAGIIATAVMTAFLGFAQGENLSTGDFLRAFGSRFTKSHRHAIPVGLAIHFAAGIVFAFLYSLIISVSPAQNWLHYAAVGSGLGFFHAFVMYMLLMISVAEHHPLRRFRRSGWNVAIVYWIAHVIFGATIGLSFAFLGFNKYSGV